MSKIDVLLKIAEEKIVNSYSKYSGIRVVAVLVAKDGSIHYGVNIENASYGLTICAERVAIFKAVSEGKREFEKMLIYSPDIIPWPCGACRQVMSEFFKGDEEIIIATKAQGKIKVHKIRFEDLFPSEYKFSFSRE